MYRCFYSLSRVPDFSLNKYSSLSETGPTGVIEQHDSFWRQMNQWGKLFQGRIHLLYSFMPEKNLGEQMMILIILESPSMDGLIYGKQLMASSVLAPYYDQLRETQADNLLHEYYAYQVNLFKKERYIQSSTNKDDCFYVASKWKVNDNARLYSMMKMMETLDKKCIYMVNLYPVDYSSRLENGLTYPMKQLRELSSFRVKTSSNTVSSDGKDEGAKEALKYYEDLLEGLMTYPHFLINIQALCENENCAKMILDAAGSEAVNQGTYELYGERFDGDVEQILNEGFICLAESEVPEVLKVLPYLYTVDEVPSMAILPVLYAGECIALPKETVPEKQEGLLIGLNSEHYEFFYPWNLLTKHGFLAGMPGSGKTNAMMYLVTNIHKAGIPVLVMEPAKKEYRILATLNEMTGTYLFSPSANSVFPIHINPFEFPKGMKLAEHINALLDVFNGTFELDPPMPMLLAESIQECYEELGWAPGMYNMGKLKYPTLSMMYDHIKTLLDKYKYAPDVRSNLESILQVRIGSLMQREMGDIFDVACSTFPPEEWIEHSAIIELASIGTAPTNFMMLILLTLIREELGLKTYIPNSENYCKPRHVIFLEEAHNLIANTSVQMPGTTNPKIAATAFLKDMLAEVRALGEGIIIADQLPTSMAPEVIKNTSLKIGLRLTAVDERNLLGETMSADGVQLEKLGIFTPGQALVSYEKLLKPFELQIPEFYAKNEVLSDKQLLYLLLNTTTYKITIINSMKIVDAKYKQKLEKINHASELILDQNKQAVAEHKSGNITKRKLLEKEKELKHRANELIDNYFKLSLDIYLNLGPMHIAWKLSEGGEAHGENCAAFKKYRNTYINNLILPSRNKRKKFVHEFNAIIKLLDEPEFEKKCKEFEMQQRLINESWESWMREGETINAYVGNEG